MKTKFKSLGFALALGLCGNLLATPLQFTSSVVSEIKREPSNGSLIVTLTHSGPGLADVKQILTLQNAAGIDLGVIRQQAISQIKTLNDNLTFEDSFKTLVGTSLDIVTPVPKTADQIATDAFFQLRQREVALRVSVSNASAKQAELDAAIADRKTAYDAGTISQKKTFDDIMRMIP